MYQEFADMACNRITAASTRKFIDENNLKSHGRWGFAESREVHQSESDFVARVEEEFNHMIDLTISKAG